MYIRLFPCFVVYYHVNRSFLIYICLFPCTYISFDVHTSLLTYLSYLRPTSKNGSARTPHQWCTNGCGWIATSWLSGGAVSRAPVWCAFIVEWLRVLFLCCLCMFCMYSWCTDGCGWIATRWLSSRAVSRALVWCVFIVVWLRVLFYGVCVCYVCIHGAPTAVYKSRRGSWEVEPSLAHRYAVYVWIRVFDVFLRCLCLLFYVLFVYMYVFLMGLLCRRCVQRLCTNQDKVVGRQSLVFTDRLASFVCLLCVAVVGLFFLFCLFF